MRNLPEPPSGQRYIHGTSELVGTKANSRLPGHIHPLQWTMLSSEQRPPLTAEWLALKKQYREASARRSLDKDVLDEWPPAGHAVLTVHSEEYHSALGFDTRSRTILDSRRSPLRRRSVVKIDRFLNAALAVEISDQDAAHPGPELHESDSDGSKTGCEFQDSECSTHSCPYESDGWSCISEDEEFHERGLTAVACGEPSTDDPTSRGEPFDLESAPRLSESDSGSCATGNREDEEERAHVFAAIEALARMANNHTVVGPAPPTPGELAAVDTSLAAVCQVSCNSSIRSRGKRRRHPTTDEINEEIASGIARSEHPKEWSAAQHKEKILPIGDAQAQLRQGYGLVAKSVPRNKWDQTPGMREAINKEWAKLRAADGGQGTWDEAQVRSFWDVKRDAQRKEKETGEHTHFGFLSSTLAW